MNTLAPRRFGKYLLLQRIAAGGMAEVFKARYQAHEDVEKIVVVKRILPHLAREPDLIDMFRDEAKITVRLSHPNIVQVFDFGEVDSDYYLAMEYVPGTNLHSLLRAQRKAEAVPLPVPCSLFIAAEVAKALQYAHTRKSDSGQALRIVHRDVTPSNILVSYDAQVKIADFGIAKAATRVSGTRTGIVKGKPSYLAPEQVQLSPIDHRADVFALGVVLWEMLTGIRLFKGENDFQVIEAIKALPISAPSDHNFNVSKELDHIALRALERDREARYPSAGDLQTDLIDALGTSTTASVELERIVDRLFSGERAKEEDFVRAAAKMDATAALDVEFAPPEGSLAATRQTFDRPRRNRRAGFYVFAAVLIAGLTYAAVQLTPKDSAPTPVQQTATPTPTQTRARAETPARTRTPNRRTPTATATASVLKGAGTLNLRSEPTWGYIHVDGAEIGKETPAFDLRLSAGTHEILVINPVANLEARFRLRVKDGAVINRTVTLKPRQKTIR